MNLAAIIARIQTLRAIAQTEPEEIDCDALRASDHALNGYTLPFTLYDVETADDADGNIMSAKVVPVTVTRHGINATVGASAPSITVRDANGKTYLSSARMYYLSVEDAQKEVDYLLAAKRHADAKAELEHLLQANLDAILSAAARGA